MFQEILAILMVAIVWIFLVILVILMVTSLPVWLAIVSVLVGFGITAIDD